MVVTFLVNRRDVYSGTRDGFDNRRDQFGSPRDHLSNTRDFFNNGRDINQLAVVTRFAKSSFKSKICSTTMT